jgi:hypothetical protein
LADAAATQAQNITGGSSVAFGPDGTLYMLGFGIITTTPGAYLATTSALGTPRDFLKHFDPATGRILYATYLSFSATGISVDSSGAEPAGPVPEYPAR